MSVAMVASGLATFALLHSAQALLPALGADFGVSAATTGLTVSVATGALALAVIPVSTVSERFGRRRVMVVALGLAVGFGLVATVCPTYPALLAVRALSGLAVAGIPAVTIAYLAEEVDPDSLAGIVGLVIAGNSVGGLVGRLLAGTLGDYLGWRWGLLSVAVMALVCWGLFVLLLPPQRHFRPTAVSLAGLLVDLRGHVRDLVLVRLYLLGGLAMAGFATVYNYVGYHLIQPPYSLPPAVAGLVFVVYLAGTTSSTVAGRMVERLGVRPVLVATTLVGAVGAAVTLARPLPLVLTGLVLHTVAFFATHAVASGAVGARATAARAQASSLYTLVYYVGSSLGGWIGGLWYDHSGWPGMVWYLLVLSLCAVLVSAKRLNGGNSCIPGAS